MNTNDTFNSFVGQYKNYTTIIGGEPPKTKIPPAATYPINVWSKQNFDSTCQYTNLLGSSFSLEDKKIKVSSSLSSERRFVFDDLNIFENCAAVIEFNTPSSNLNSFSIGALLRYNQANNTFICLGIDSQNLTIKTFDGVNYATAAFIPCVLSANTPYWIVAIAVDHDLRCELWQEDPRTIGSGSGVRKTVISTTLSTSAFDGESKVGIANWVPKGQTATINSFETGRAFSSTLEDNISDVLKSRHVDIRSMINETQIAPRLIQQIEKFHQSQNVYSQTINLKTDPVSGTFKILVYQSKDNYFQPAQTTNLNWNATADEIKSAVASVVASNYRFSNFDGDNIISVTRPNTGSCFPFTIEFNHFYGDLSLLRADVSLLKDVSNSIPQGEADYWDDINSIATFKSNFEDKDYIQSGDPLDTVFTQRQLRTSDFRYGENWKLYSVNGGAVVPPLSSKDLKVYKSNFFDKQNIAEVHLPLNFPWSFSLQSSLKSVSINSLISNTLSNFSINVSFLEFHKDLISNNSYIQFTSNKDGLFHNQGGNALDDSATVSIRPKLTGTSGNIDFRAPMSDFQNLSPNARFSFGNVTGVRFVFYNGTISAFSPYDYIRIATIRAIDDILYKNINLEIDTRTQNVKRRVPITGSSIIKIPSMIRGTTLEGILDSKHLDGQVQCVIRISDNLSVAPQFNKIQTYSRYIYNYLSSNAEWVTTEFGFNENHSYIKTFKTLRFRSIDDSNPEMYWDIHPGSATTVTEITGHPEWDPLTKYNVGDIVEHYGFVYKALKTNVQHPNKLFDIEPAEFLPNSEYWGRVDTLSDLKKFDSSSRYIVSNSLESNGAFTSIELYNFNPITIYQSPKFSNGEWKEKSGRVGWHAEILDDTQIESFSFDSTGFAVLRTKEMLSNTPIDGAQLFTKDSGYKNVFENFSSHNPREYVSIDNFKTKSGNGSYKLIPDGRTDFPGFISNQFTIESWSIMQIAFDIFVPPDLNSSDVKPKIYLQPADFTIYTEENEILNYIGPIEFGYTPNVWSSVSVDLRQFSKYPTGEYYLLVMSGYPHIHNVWIDNAQINQRTVEWSIRAKRGGAWVPFRNSVNNAYGAVHFSPDQRGKEIQLQARAMTEDAWIAEYTLKPRYANNARLLYLNEDQRAATVTGTGYLGNYEEKNTSIDTKGIWKSITTYSIADLVEYNGLVYASLQNSNLNHTPASPSAYWRIASYVNQWVSGVYDIGDIVKYNNAFYVCIQQTTTQAPTDNSYWRKLTAMTQSGIDAYAIHLNSIVDSGDIELSSDGRGEYTIAI